MGRDCEAQIGMRVVQLDPLVDIRECSQATNAFLHSHGLPQAALGLIMRILGQTCAVWACLCAVSCFSGAVVIKLNVSNCIAKHWSCACLAAATSDSTAFVCPCTNTNTLMS